MTLIIMRDANTSLHDISTVGVDQLQTFRYAMGDHFEGPRDFTVLNCHPLLCDSVFLKVVRRLVDKHSIVCLLDDYRHSLSSDAQHGIKDVSQHQKKKEDKT